MIADESRNATHGAAAASCAHALLEAAGDGIAVVDTGGALTYVNAAAAAMLRFESYELVGRDAFDLVHPDDQVGAAEGFQSTLSTADSRATPLLLRLRCADGSWLDTEIIATNRLADHLIQGLVLTIRDVSESMRTDDALRRSEARYRLIVELAREGVWLIDCDGVTTYANRAMAEMLRTTVPNMIGRTLFEFMDDEGREDALDKLARRRAGISEEHDFRLMRCDGTFVWTRMNTSPMLRSDGTYDGAVALVTDVTERRALELKLKRDARSDPLTGVANRHTLFEVLAATLSRPSVCALLYLDIDYFKGVNDTYGHATGDEVLRAVASRISAASRDGDTVARVGGDEFVVVCSDLTAPDDAVVVAERIRASLASPIRAHKDLTVDVSIGVAFANGDDADSLIARADAALYQAKDAGRGRVQIARQ